MVTGTKTVTSTKGKERAEQEEKLEVFEGKENLLWLGDQESNLGSKIQNLMSCP